MRGSKLFLKANPKIHITETIANNAFEVDLISLLTVVISRELISVSKYNPSENQLFIPARLSIVRAIKVEAIINLAMFTKPIVSLP